MERFYVEITLKVPMPDEKQGVETAKLLAALLTGLNIRSSAMEWHTALLSETLVLVPPASPESN